MWGVMQAQAGAQILTVTLAVDDNDLTDPHCIKHQQSSLCSCVWTQLIIAVSTEQGLGWNAGSRSWCPSHSITSISPTLPG